MLLGKINIFTKMDYKYIYIIDTFSISNNSLYAFDNEEKCYNFLKKIYSSYTDKDLKKMVKESILLDIMNNPQKFNLDLKYITFGYTQIFYGDNKYYYYENKVNYLKETFYRVNKTVDMIIYKHKDELLNKNNKNNPEKCIEIKKYNETQITTIYIKNYIDDTYFLVENLPIF